jgi:hypothetical protein
MDESWDDVDFDDIDVIGSDDGSAADARQAADEAAAALDKITAQMTGGEHRSEQQGCRAVAEAFVTRSTSWSKQGRARASRWPTWCRPR